MSGIVCQGYPPLKDHIDYIAWNDESCASYFPWLCGFTSWKAAGNYAISSCWLSEIGVPFTDTTMGRIFGNIDSRPCLFGHPPSLIGK